MRGADPVAGGILCVSAYICLCLCLCVCLCVCMWLHACPPPRLAWPTAHAGVTLLRLFAPWLSVGLGETGSSWGLHDVEVLTESPHGDPWPGGGCARRGAAETEEPSARSRSRAMPHFLTTRLCPGQSAAGPLVPVLGAVQGCAGPGSGQAVGLRECGMFLCLHPVCVRFQRNTCPPKTTAHTPLQFSVRVPQALGTLIHACRCVRGGSGGAWLALCSTMGVSAVRGAVPGVCTRVWCRQSTL